MDNCPANTLMCNLIKEWSFSKAVNDLGNLGKKFTAEPASLRLVPKLRFGNVQFSGATDSNFVPQRSSRSRRAFASGQEL